jgi:ferric-dicitrate binding protein FerR (iron transport regulator)
MWDALRNLRRTHTAIGMPLAEIPQTHSSNPQEREPMNTTRRQVGKTLSAVALGVAALGFSSLASAADTIKVGVLHSLSGTMAISESVLKDTVLMAIDEINAKGGVLGKQAGARRRRPGV